MNNAEKFFTRWAGYSWDLRVETQEQGRVRCAQALARAEAAAREAGVVFEWREDDRGSSEWSEKRPSWAQWVCIARDADGRVVASLGGIDFGRGREPWGNPYQRVVEAEVAAEAVAHRSTSCKTANLY